MAPEHCIRASSVTDVRSRREYWRGRVPGMRRCDLLEQLSTQYPMIGPAEITRDPLYAMPLAANARYQVLESRLEAEIAANQQWRDPD